jgi:hypothetical protein
LNITPAGPDSTNTSGTGNPAGPAAGRWQVSYFLDDGTDMTQHLNGYSFTFNTDGTMSVNTGAGTVNGTWRTGIDDSKQKFLISLVNADAMLAELNEDWLIKTNTASEIDLNKTGGHPREVHFTKQ